MKNLDRDRYRRNAIANPHPAFPFELRICLPQEEEYALIRAYKNGDANAGYRLVASVFDFGVAYVRSAFPTHFDLERDEVPTIVIIALYEALQGFDFGKANGAQFGTYAKAHIQKLIVRQIRTQAYPYKISTSDNKKKTGFTTSLLWKYLREAKKAGMDYYEAIEHVTAIFSGKTKTVRTHIRVLALQMYSTMSSIHSPVSNSSAVTIGDLLADVERDSPEDEALQRVATKNRRNTLKRILMHLSERERYILTQRELAIDPPSFRTLGKKFGITGERARQIHREAYARVTNLVTRTPMLLV